MNPTYKQEYLIVVLVVFSGFLDNSIYANDPAAIRPNIVLILADDLGYGDLGCYGHPFIRSPNIDQLGKQGWRFTQFYAAAPMCSPSRAGLMTGRTPNRTGVFDWIAHDGSSKMHLPESEITFASLMQSVGYQTALHGKWHLNSRFNSPSQPQPDDHGFDYWFATQFSPNHWNPNGFVRNGKELKQQKGYACQIVVDDAIEWLINKRIKDKPFFQFVSFHEPHHPVASPPVLVAEHFGTTTDNKNEAIYFANVENLANAVGRYLKALERLSLTENTIVILTSDHGPQTLGKGVFKHSYGRTNDLRGRKRYLWEGGIRVPGIIRWPKRLTPRVEETVVGFVDFMPTFAALCGYVKPMDRTIDGSDISNLLLGNPFERDQPLHWHFYSPLGGPQSVMRKGDWLLTARWNTGIRPFKGGTRMIPEFKHLFSTAKLINFELYDLRLDPQQANDLATKQPDVVETMKKQLQSLHANTHN